MSTEGGTLSRGVGGSVSLWRCGFHGNEHPSSNRIGNSHHENGVPAPGALFLHLCKRPVKSFAGAFVVTRLS